MAGAGSGGFPRDDKRAARLARHARRAFVLFAALAGTAFAASDLADLGAARSAAHAAEGQPAVVVLWTPGCLACRKSLAELERFTAIAAQDGVAVRTLVPAAQYADARRLLAERGISLHVAAADDQLDTPSRRLLLDSALAYAIDREGRVVATRGGLLAVRVLEGLAHAAKSQ